MEEESNNLPELPGTLSELSESNAFMEEWNKFGVRNQIFLALWMNNRYNATKAWMEAYGYDPEKYVIAAAAASRFLASEKVRRIRELISEAIYHPVEQAMEIENNLLMCADPNIQLRAAKQVRERVANSNPNKINPMAGSNVQINNYNFNPVQLKDILNSNSKGR